MRVLFIDRILDPRVYIYIYPPIGALYLLGAARARGHEADLFLTGTSAACTYPDFRK